MGNTRQHSKCIYAQANAELIYQNNFCRNIIKSLKFCHNIENIILYGSALDP